MASELQYSVNFKCQNGSYLENFNKVTQTANQNALGASAGIATVTTTASTINVGSVTTLGYLLLQNLDATNYLTFGVLSGSYIPVGKLKPGEVAMLRLQPGITFQWQANTASVECQYLLLQD